MQKVKHKDCSPDQWAFDLTEKYHVQFDGYGTSTYEQSFKVYCESNLIGALFTNPKIKSGHFQNTSVGFKVANNLLYSENWLDIVLDFVKEIKFEFSNITRLDIAMDGANHVMKFFTQFTAFRLIEKENHYILKAGKAQMMPKALDSAISYFDGFQIGSRKSERHLIIYNKTKELKNSQKDYIKDFWLKSGIDKKELDYMIRVEVVIRGKLLTDYNLENMNLLLNKNHLVSLFQKNTVSYLDFRYLNDKDNISRCSPHALIDYKDINFVLLEKTKMKERDGLYKIKMSIHADFIVMCKGLDGGNAASMIEDINNKVMLYGLEEWYNKSRDKWKAVYKCYKNTGHVYELTQF